MARSSTLIWLSSVLVVATLAATMTRLPISQGDGPFYASIARSYAWGNPGVPSVLAPGAPTAVDHIRFYGPVFFRTVSLVFSTFGTTVASLRAVNLLGVLLFAGAATYVCRVLGGGPERRAWTWLLLLLTPEAATASASGRMDSLAVGIEMWGFAILIDGFVRQDRPWRHGLAAGTLLAAAALTTPRTFPFLAGLALAAFVEHYRAATITRAMRVQAAVAAVTLIAIVVVWTCLSFGGPLPWLRFMSYVATHENTDIALLPSATMRDLMFTWWQSITVVFAIAGALVTAWLMRGRDVTPQAVAGSFALVTTWTTLVLTMTIFNYTFWFNMYFVLPLAAVVIGLPTPLSEVRRRQLATVAAALFVVFTAVRAGRLLHAAVTWDARDPSALDLFVANHVPPGSRVLGPASDFFFPVEAARSRYFAIPQVSRADWSRWVHPQLPGAPPPPNVRGDYLLWRVGDPPPPADVACAIDAVVATYEPPPLNLPALAWVAAPDPYAIYRETTLFRLRNAPCRS